jgi:hypothetical protein
MDKQTIEREKEMPTEYEEEEYVYAHCMDCGTELDEDSAWYSEHDNEYRCERHHDRHEELCAENEDDDDGFIHNYSFKPSPNFLEDDGTASFYTPATGHTKTLYMGFELETELTRPTVVRGNSLTPGAEHVLSTINKRIGSDNVVYLKDDGSISHGFEIVSHPMTLGFAMNHFDWSGIEGLKGLGYDAWKASSCGLHIHLSRDAFADYGHMMRFFLLILKNRQQLVQFAGRESHYAKFDMDAFFNAYHDYDSGKTVRGSTLASHAKQYSTNNDRYTAINLQNNNTIELRFFRPSLLASTVKACLQFCDAAFNYTSEITLQQILQNQAIQFASFHSWVRFQGDKYRILDERIVERCGIRGEDI